MMDSRILKGSFYLILLFLIMVTCGCTEYTGKKLKSEVYVSKTVDDVPVTIKGYRYIDDDLEHQVIDEALDKVISEYTLYEIAQTCEATVMELESYFGFVTLELALERKHNVSDLWPDSKNCPIILNRPEM